MTRQGRGLVRASMVWLEVFAFASGAGEAAAPSQRFGFRRIQREGRGAKHGGRSSARLAFAPNAAQTQHRSLRCRTCSLGVPVSGHLLAQEPNH
jgi:hypothetical protein